MADFENSKVWKRTFGKSRKPKCCVSLLTCLLACRYREFFFRFAFDNLLVYRLF